MTAAFDIVVTGFVYFEVYVPPDTPFIPGEEHFAPAIPIGLGGALNTASVARALGNRTALVYPRGTGLTDRAIDAVIADLGLPTVSITAPADPAVTLVMSRDGERSFVSSARFDAFEAFPPLPATRWIHVPGLAEAHALREPLARSRATGAKVSVSASWVPDALDALASLEDTPWDMLVLNAKEAARAAGDAERALTALRGAAVDIVVTDGPKGAFGIVDGTLIESRGEPLEVSDATGAGDAFAAGLLTARVRGAAPRDSIAFARRVAERKLAHRGGVAFDPDVYANLEVKT